MILCVFFFQAEDGIRDAQESRGLGDVYKRQFQHRGAGDAHERSPVDVAEGDNRHNHVAHGIPEYLSLIHI